MLRELLKEDVLKPGLYCEDDTVEKPERDVQIAYHEAGHAIASILLRRTFKFVSIRKWQGSEGRVHCNPSGDVWHKIYAKDTPEKKRRKLLEREIKVSQAGPIALLLFTTDCGILCIPDKKEPDFEEIREYQEIGGFSNEEIDVFEADITALLADHWFLVEAVAEALMEAKRLQYRQIRNIVKEYVEL